MAVYSINDVEKLTGIRAHTLRAWEQRYDLIAPRRSKANVRYYLEEDLRELSGIALLNKHGYRISKIAAMSPDERTELVTSLSSLNVSPDTQLDALTLAVVELNEYKFSLILNTNIEQRGFEETMMEVVYPFLDKLGVLYFTGSVAPVQESFVGGIIRQKILSATDRLPAAERSRQPVFVLFLPEGERQDLSMLFIQYLLRKRGFPTLYLGTGISPTDLADLCRATRVDYLLTLLSNSYVERPVEELVADMLEQCPDARLLLSGYQASLHDLSGFERVDKVAGLQEMLSFLTDLSTHAGLSIAAAR
ncbi:MerR family transcriptional regulator [Lewinella sp. JB7]|uniref:MerR family transcriptional regulator n=1 Tax=Lewinella sp. JB7 TaxID=2962887 RepID=UPI0020C9AECF|nr:MerR family transcriptional regulator [Lewinella sp. JB7]MCP9236862.1 MerR family transcriptional regulator [Lewinella sp. JB7]